jgi:hypothetical protein
MMDVTHGKFSDESVNERIKIAFTKIKIERGMQNEIPMAENEFNILSVGKLGTSASVSECLFN